MYISKASQPDSVFLTKSYTSLAAATRSQRPRPSFQLHRYKYTVVSYVAKGSHDGTAGFTAAGESSPRRPPIRQHCSITCLLSVRQLCCRGALIVSNSSEDVGQIRGDIARLEARIVIKVHFILERISTDIPILGTQDPSKAIQLFPQQLSSTPRIH